MLAGKFSFLPIFVQGANVADERRDASNRAHQQMVSASAAGLQCKPSFGNLSHLNFVAHLQFVDERGQFTLGDELKEEFNFTFVRGGNNRIGPLVAFFCVLHSQGRILPRSELELSLGLDANHPKIGGVIRTLGNSGAVKLLIATAHDHPHA